MSDQRPSEPGSAAERLAEMMAWHGMARYADPDDLARYARPDGQADREPPEPATG